MGLTVIILAAGQGTRMRSELPKVLQPLAGKPLLAHVLDCAHALGADDICVVYGHGGDEVRAAFVDHDPAAAAAFEPNERDRWQADLYALGRQRLAARGVTAVYGGGLCTYANPERIYSFRRDGQTGRLYSFIFRAD